MALVSVQRSPSNSNSSSTISVSDNDDEPDFDLKRVCECFFAIKGAALILPHSTDPRPIKKHPVVGELQQHLQSIFFLLRAQDTITLAVRLENTYNTNIRYMVLVSTLGVDDTEETIILGVDLQDTQCLVGLVLPIWGDTGISMDGDGGFGVHTSARSYIFKPVSIQAMWSAIQCLNKTCQIARNKNYIPTGLNLTWAGYYTALPLSSTKSVYEWNLLPDTFTHFHEHMTYHEGYVDVDGGHFCPSERELTERYIWVKLKEIMTQVDLDSITGKYLRLRLEEEMGRDLKEYKSAIDEQAMIILGQMDSASKILDFLYLGSEWNASNFVEMDKVGIRYILNISTEIDNFFPSHFTYKNVRVMDDEQADLLRYWDDTYRYLSKAKETGTKAFVHCKMGISRSAATVIAFVMKEMGWSLDRAFKHVKERRKIVQPNPAFMKQLHEYQGILDASKQRHNALWRSKSESSLSTCESLENLSSIAAEVFNSSSEDLKDLNASSLRRRSWSPDDATANALLNYPDPSGISHAGEMYLRNPSPTSEGHLGDEEEGDYSSEDECSEIHIPVPSIQQRPPSLQQHPDQKGPDVTEDSGELYGATGGVEPEKEGKHIIESSPPCQEKLRPSEKKSPESEKLLNTNNNSANVLDVKNEGKDVALDIGKKTEDGAEEEEEVAIPVDVKERISSIESQISRLDSTGSPEKSHLESPLLEELPIDTVRRRKEKLEQKIKGNLGEDEDCGEDEVDTFTMEAESSAEISETIPTVSEAATEVEDLPEAKELDTPEEASQKDVPSIKGDLLQRRDQSPLETLPPQYSSPSLSNVEPGSVQKSKEKFQSWQTKGWKSPTFGQDSYIKFDSLKHTKPPPGKEETEQEGVVSGALLPDESSDGNMVVVDQEPIVIKSDREATAEATQVPSSGGSGVEGEEEEEEKKPSSEDPQAVKVDEEDEDKMDTDVGSLSDPNTVILHATGEEIPLQPGTVKRQTQGFEQLQLEGGSEKSNKVARMEDSDEVSSEEMEVAAPEAGDSGDDGKGSETPPQSEEVVSAEADSSSDTLTTAVDDRNDDETDRSEDHQPAAKKMEADEEDRSGIDDLCSPPPATPSQDADDKEEEEASSEDQGVWKPGNVKKHAEELEKKSAESGQTKSPLPSSKVCSDQAEANLTTDQLQVIRDLGKMILGKDGSVEEEAEQVPDEGAKENIPSEEAETTQEEKGSDKDYVNVLERVRKIEVKRCASIASMSSDKVASKYRKRISKDGSQGERSPAKDQGRGDRDSPVSSKKLDNSLVTERLRPAVGTDSDADQLRPDTIQRENSEEVAEGVGIMRELISDEAMRSNANGSPSRSDSSQGENMEKDATVNNIEQNSETGSRVVESGSLANEDNLESRVNSPMPVQMDTAQITRRPDKTEAISVSLEEGKGEVSTGGSFKRDPNTEHLSPTAVGKGPPQVQRLSLGEKKPYGPSHPLARLRKTSSGKHPFYSTM